MRHYVPDKHLAGQVIDARRQPKFVTANIEDSELANRIRVWVRFSHIHEAGPMQSLHRPIPIVERCLRVQVNIGELAKGLAADDPHTLYTLKMRAVSQALASGYLTMDPVVILLGS